MKRQSQDKRQMPTIGRDAGGAGSASACGHHPEAKVTDVLMDEHRVIERVLAVVEQLVEVKGEPPLAKWKLALDFFRHFADQCHHYKEEKVLFPAMETHGVPCEGGPIGMMLLEHEEGRGHVRSMQHAVSLVEVNNPAGKDILINSARAYVRLLREHIQKEDEVLFTIASDVIPDAEQRSLSKMLEKHEAEEIGTGVHEKYLKIVEELEKCGN